MTGRDDDTSLPAFPTPLRASDDMQDVDYFDADDDDLDALDAPSPRTPNRLPMVLMGIVMLAMLAGGSYVALQIVDRSAPQMENTTSPVPPAPPPPPQPVAQPAPPAPSVVEPAPEPTPVPEVAAAEDALVTLPPEALPEVLPENPPVVEEVPTTAVELPEDVALPEETAVITPPAPEPDLGPEDFYEAKDVVKALENMQQGDAPALILEEPTPQPYIEITKPNAKSEVERNILLAERALAIGRYQMAADLYNEVLTRNDQDARALIGRAIASQNLGNVPQAISDYEAALTLKPENTEAMINLLGLIQREQPQAALSRLDTLARKYPSHPGIVAQQATIQADLGNLVQAGALLERAMMLEPSNPMHYYNRAIIADRLGDTRTAIELYERCLEVDAIHFAGRKVPRERVYDRLSQLRRG